MEAFSTKNPVITLVFVIAAVVGGIVTITNPDTLNFSEYLLRLAIFGGALGIGRGIAEAGKPTVNVDRRRPQA